MNMLKQLIGEGRAIFPVIFAQVACVAFSADNHSEIFKIKGLDQP